MTDACPVCAAQGEPIGTHVRDGERWTCLSCRACDCQYWYPREIRPEFYADPEQEATYERRRGGESFLRARHRLFLKRAKPGRLLDIGCGEGAFLAAAKDRGFEVAGIDLDPGSIEVATRRGLSRVQATPLFEPATGDIAPALAGQEFDTITAFEVLEHQAQPIEFLRAARRLLVSGGSMCGSVPNRGRLFVDRQRRANSGDFPPHHFLWFSAKTLAHTLEVAGFENVEIRPVPEDELLPYASYLEDTLLSAVTRSAKRSVKKMASGERRSSGRKQIINALRLVKNIPFVPLALAVRTVAPMRLRSLYFEARA